MRRRRARRAVRRLQWLEGIFALLAVIALALLIVQLIQRNIRSEEEQSSTEQFAVLLSDALDPMATPAPESVTAEASETSTPSTPVPSLPSQPPVMDAAAELLAQNGDFVGMIGFEDMALYVCQSDDNAYYASHRFDGSEDAGGMIYLDFRCSLWPMSDNTILYGHNMQDGSRFGKLQRFTNQEYLIENANIRFATLYEIREYIPVAVFYTSVDPAHEDYFDFAQVSFEDEASFDNYIREVRQRSLFDIPVDVEYGDLLLTLATCSEEYDGGRIVVVCVQIS